MNAPRKSKTVSDREINKTIDTDFEHGYYEEHMDAVPTIFEGLGDEQP